MIVGIDASVKDRCVVILLEKAVANSEENAATVTLWTSMTDLVVTECSNIAGESRGDHSIRIQLWQNFCVQGFRPRKFGRNVKAMGIPLLVQTLTPIGPS